MNNMNYKLEMGQTIIELLISVAIFVVVASGFSFFILDSYSSGRLAKEAIIGNFLAEEGLEAVRSIRDNSWDDLTNGEHGLALSGSNWIFSGSQENISGQLGNGTRKIIVEDAGSDRKKVTSQINWQFALGRPEEIRLVTYLTNWQKELLIEIRKPTARTDYANRTTQDQRAYDSPNGSTFATTNYDYDEDPSITFHTWQLATRPYTSLVLKYRYHADQGTDDTYAVAYSTTGCSGVFTDLIPPTSAGASDTTVSANLDPGQDLSELCVKIYTKRNGARDRKNIYTRDIWTEGTY
jgi:type II secretory pathway pseudopilin PulG